VREHRRCLRNRFLQLAQQPEPLVRRPTEIVEPPGIDRRVFGRDQGVQDHPERHRPRREIPVAAENPAPDPRPGSRPHPSAWSCRTRGPGDEHDAAAPGAEHVQLPAQHVNLRLPTAQSGRHRAIVIEVSPLSRRRRCSSSSWPWRGTALRSKLMNARPRRATREQTRRPLNSKTPHSLQQDWPGKLPPHVPVA
jgi:hypothetical protein